jgi:hypothetical protein
VIASRSLGPGCLGPSARLPTPAPPNRAPRLSTLGFWIFSEIAKRIDGVGAGTVTAPRTTVVLGAISQPTDHKRLVRCTA